MPGHLAATLALLIPVETPSRFLKERATHYDKQSPPLALTRSVFYKCAFTSCCSFAEHRASRKPRLKPILPGKLEQPQRRAARRRGKYRSILTGMANPIWRYSVLLLEHGGSPKARPALIRALTTSPTSGGYWATCPWRAIMMAMVRQTRRCGGHRRAHGTSGAVQMQC